MTIEFRFNKIKESNRNLGDVIIFNMAVEGMAYNKKEVTDSFNRLVEKADYTGKKDQYIDYASELTFRGLKRAL